MASASLNELFNYLYIQKGLSDHSVQSYLSDYKNLNLIDEELCSQPDTEQILEKLTTLKASKKTIARKFYALKNYYEFFNLIWPKAFPKIQVEASIPFVPSLEKVSQMLESVSLIEKNEIFKRRDLCILYLMYGIGLRISEVQFLGIDDINLSQKIIRVEGKGKKERVLPLIGPVQEVIKSFLEVRSKLNPTTKKLILNSRGKLISRQGLWKLVLKYGKPYGIHPHSLRHAFASHCLSNGLDIRSLQVLLGHSSPNTTQIYTRVDHAKMLDLLTKSNPFF